MLAAERRNIILEKVYENKKVIVGELSRELAVSEETIRRDLERLEEDGHVIKSYGGAVLNEHSSIEIPFNVRWKANPSGKQKIAELVSRQIEEGDHIFLDASTTAVFIAKNIKQKRRLTVITNSIENLLELSNVPDLDVISTGGMLKAGTMSLLGQKAGDSISAYNADKVFFSCKGIDLVKGVGDGNDETAGVKQAMIESAAKVYLAVDSTKFGKSAFSRICHFSAVDVIITDKKPEEEWLEMFDRQGIECIYE